MGDVHDTNQDVPAAAQDGNGTAAADTPATETIALDSYLSDADNKAEFDAAVAAAVAAEIDRQQAAAAEEKRIQNLTAEEKMTEKEKELEAREAKLQAAERRSAAIIDLGKAGIPAELADCFNYTSEETYKQSMEAAKTAFQAAVQAGINDRLRGKTIPVAPADTPKQERTINSFKNLILENQAKR